MNNTETEIGSACAKAIKDVLSAKITMAQCYAVVINYSIKVLPAYAKRPLPTMPSDIREFRMKSQDIKDEILRKNTEFSGRYFKWLDDKARVELENMRNKTHLIWLLKTKAIKNQNIIDQIDLYINQHNDKAEQPTWA